MDARTKDINEFLKRWKCVGQSPRLTQAMKRELLALVEGEQERCLKAILDPLLQAITTTIRTGRRRHE